MRKRPLVLFALTVLVVGTLLPPIIQARESAQPEALGVRPLGIGGQWSYGPEFPFWAGDGIARFSGYYWPETEMIYFLGGRLEDNSTSGMVMSFDPATEVYSNTGAVMPSPVSNYYLDRLNIDGADQICLSLGRLDDGSESFTVQCYNPATNATTEFTGDLFPGTGRLVGGQAVIGNQMYIFGGFDGTTMFTDSWVFDPSQPVGSRWTDLSCPLSSARAYIATAVIGSKIYAIGGDTFEGGGLVPQAVTEVLDTANLPACWQDGEMADLPAGSENGDFPGVYVDGPYALAGYIYTTGGYWPATPPPGGPYPYFFQYNPDTDTWDVGLQSLNQARRNHAMVFVPPLGGHEARLWVFGGYDNTGTNAMTASSEYFEAVPLSLLPPTQILIGEPCAWISTTLSLVNSTGATDTFTVTYSGNTWPVQGPAEVGPVADGGTITFTVAISVPCDATCFEQDTVLVGAAAQSNPVITDTAVITTTSGGATLEGHVFDANFPGTGIYGAYLYMEDAADPDIYYETTTDLDGAYAFIDIYTGTYILDVSAIGYEPIFAYTVELTGCYASQDFSLNAAMVEVNPSSISEAVVEGEAVQATLTISNPGTADLLYHIEEIGAGNPVPIPAGAGQPPMLQRVDPQIYEEIAKSPEGTTKFLIVLEEQADLSAAFAIQDWDARGQYVYDALKTTAERSQAGLRQFLADQGLSYRPVLVSNGLWVEAGLDVLNSVAARSDVAYIMANRLVETLPEPAAPAIPEAFGWNIDLARADEVWSIGITGTGVVVASIDTGVWYTHNALRNQYRGYDGITYTHDYNWFHPTSPTGCDGSVHPCDNDGHGTSVTGIIVGDDGGGNQIGMAPGATWIACKGCEFNWCSSEALLGCADWMLAPFKLDGSDPDPSKRPHVVSNSWGGAQEDGWYFPAVAAWRAAGMFPSFANGNGGPECSTAHSPGDYYNSFSSGAIYYAGPGDYQIASYSSRGPTPLYGLLKPNIAAPADPVYTSNTGGDDNYRSDFNGTSSATPHTSGEVALIWSAQPRLIGQIEQTEWLIEQTAFPMTTSQACGGLTGVPNNVWGWGIIDAYEAVTQALAIDWTVPWMGIEPMGGAVAPGSMEMLTVTLDSTGLMTDVCYSATIKIESNSPYASQWPTMSLDVYVPVELCVLACVEPYNVGFSWTPMTPTVGQMVAFTGSASGDEPITYTWGFGDGGTGEGAMVTHTYAATGTYTVVVTATNVCGAATATYDLAVEEAIPGVWTIYLPLVLKNYQ